MTKLNRKISTARKLRQPRQKLRLKRQSRPLEAKTLVPKPRVIGTSSNLEKTGGQSTFVARNTTEDAKVELQQVLPGASWLPRGVREFWLRYLKLRRSYPRHVVSLVTALSFALIGMLISGGWLAMKGRASKPAEPPTPVAIQKEVEPTRDSLAKSKGEEAVQSLMGFISAATVEDKLKFVRLPELVEPEIRELFENPSEWNKVIPTEVGPDPVFTSFQLLGVDTDVLRIRNVDGLTLFLFAHSADGRQLVDWEAAPFTNQKRFEEFRENRTTQPERFRITVKPDNYFNYGFSEDEYYSLQIAHVSELDKKSYAYVKKGSAAEKSLVEVYPAIGNYFGDVCVYAELRYPTDSQSADHLEFVSLVYPGWVLPDSFYVE